MVSSLYNGVTVTWNRRIFKVFLVICDVVCWLWFLPVDSRMHCLSHFRFFVFSGVCVCLCEWCMHVQCAWIDVRCFEVREVRHRPGRGGKEEKAEEISIGIIILFCSNFFWYIHSVRCGRVTITVCILYFIYCAFVALVHSDLWQFWWHLFAPYILQNLFV